MNTKPRLKTERQELRLTPLQKSTLQELANKAKLSVSAYIIQMLNLPPSA